MSDATTLVKAPQEYMTSFNARLKAACAESPVTHAELSVIDGEPEVTLYSDATEADEDDVKQGLADNVGEVIPNGPTITCGVCRLRARTEEESNLTEVRLDKLFGKAEGLIDEDRTITVTGPTVESFQFDKESPVIPIQSYAHYKIVVWELEEEEEEENQDDDTTAESTTDEETETGDTSGDEGSNTPRKKGGKKVGKKGGKEEESSESTDNEDDPV